MFKVKVITQGKTKDNWLRIALAEYEKRLQGQMQIEWVLVDKEKEIEERSLKETDFIALDVLGKQLTSEQFSKRLFSDWGSRLCFVIGSADGLSPSILEKAKYKLSFSSFTFTHQMVRLILVEQLYRAIEIESGSSYHR